jgi:L,D-transpeptidase ErfK/SrfK
MVIGGESVYTVRKGDTIERIGAKLGVDWRIIVRQNNIDINKPIHPGQEFRVSARRIVPKVIDTGILINIPDRTLYFFRDRSLEDSFPVGLGKSPQTGKRNWCTPLGSFTVVRKEKNPVWHVPPSIQAEMEEEGKPVKTIVPPGPDNPLGRFALITTIPGVLIHETLWPGTVYQFRSHGCIRVAPEHMEKFYDKVEINTPGELIYMPVKVAVTDQGQVFLEVHGDVYKKMKDLRAEAKALIEKLGVSGRVNWQKVEEIVQKKSGIAEDITL